MAADHDLVQAPWRGPFPGELPTGELLGPGDLVTIRRSQLESGHFGNPRETAPAASDKPAGKTTAPKSSRKAGR